jgi:hypothetical protein
VSFCSVGSAAHKGAHNSATSYRRQQTSTSTRNPGSLYIHPIFEASTAWRSGSVYRLPLEYPEFARQRMLESGKYGTLADLADAERISRSYVCRVLRLTLLAPDIVERMLDGRGAPQLAQLMQPFPVEWERQRTQFC